MQSSQTAPAGNTAYQPSVTPGSVASAPLTSNVSQSSYPSQQTSVYQSQNQPYAATYPSSQAPGTTYQSTQLATSQPEAYPPGQQDQPSFYPGQGAYPSNQGQPSSLPPTQTPSGGQLDQTGNPAYSAQSYGAGGAQTQGAYYGAQPQYTAQSDNLGFGQGQPPQGYTMGQQQQPQQPQQQGNPYARSMSPRGQYPQPSQGYDMYYQPQKPQQPPNGYPPFPTQ